MSALQASCPLWAVTGPRKMETVDLCVSYQYNVLGTRGPRKMTAVIPPVGPSGLSVYLPSGPGDNILDRCLALVFLWMSFPDLGRPTLTASPSNACTSVLVLPTTAKKGCSLKSVWRCNEKNFRTAIVPRSVSMQANAGVAIFRTVSHMRDFPALPPPQHTPVEWSEIVTLVLPALLSSAMKLQLSHDHIQTLLAVEMIVAGLENRNVTHTNTHTHTHTHTHTPTAEL
eukprot:1157289-Pelagomonas_calceolata.AAC.9